MWRVPGNLLHVFFNINAPFRSDLGGGELLYSHFPLYLPRGRNGYIAIFPGGGGGGGGNLLYSHFPAYPGKREIWLYSHFSGEGKWLWGNNGSMTPELGQMRPLAWALNEADPIGLPALICDTLPYTINSIIMSRIAPKQDAFKFKIAPHKQNIHRNFFFLAGRWVPWPTWPCA